MVSKQNALSKRLAQRKSAVETQEHKKSLHPESSTRSITLSSGKVIQLIFQSVEGKNNIESMTKVDDGNIRDQELLSEGSLTDILSSIENIQLYPAIGYESQGIINIVDGSRRRKAAMIKNCRYTIEVTKTPLTKKEAEEIVHLSEQKKKLTYIEWGKFYQSKLDHKLYLNTKEMIEAEKISAGLMSLYLNSAQIPSSLLALFIDNSLISTQKHTKQLIGIHNGLNHAGITCNEFIQKCQNSLVSVLDSATNPEEHTELVFSILNREISKIKHAKLGRKKTNKPKIEHLGNGVTFSRKSKDSAIINLRKVSDDKKEMIKNYIRKLMA